MEKRIEVGFVFKGKPYMANVLITNNHDGYDFVINLFDKALNEAFPVSYTFIGKDNRFIPVKAMSVDNLELVDAIKNAIRRHPDNPYVFVD